MKQQDTHTQIHILVVDDVEQIRSFIRVVLLKLGFEHVDTASSSQEVIERLRKKQYSMIFLDINLPGVDGMALLRLIRDKHPKTKVIMCTGNNTEQNVKDAVAVGATGFLAKPVLAKKITTLFDRIKVPYKSLA